MPDEETPETPASPQPEAQAAAEDLAVEVEAPRSGRPAPSDEELAKHTEIPEDEIAKYQQDAQKRIKGLRVAYQEQRRRAEQWSRDASTASNLAEQLYRENQQLRQNVTRSETALIDQATARAESELEKARIKAKQAWASQDSDLIVDANENVARAVSEVDRLRLLKPAVGSPAAPGNAAPAPAEAPAPAPSQRPMSERTRSWVAQNPWFGQDAEMTQFAVRQHQHLVLDGITEEANPDLYWRTIEDKLRQQYPEKFARQTESRARPVAVTGGTRANGAAPTSAAGKRTVHLTESQVRLAQRLGLTAEQYAKQMILDEQEQAGGRVQ